MEGFNFLGMWADFNFQPTNLLFLIIPICKAAFDVLRREKRGIGVNHNKSMAISLACGALLAFIDWRVSSVEYYAQSALLGVAYFWLIFDYLRNIMAGKKFFYVDNNPMSDEVEDSWWDKWIYSNNTPLSLLFLKLWLFITAMAVYYLASYL